MVSNVETFRYSYGTSRKLTIFLQSVSHLFLRKCMIIIQKEKHKEMLCITCNSEDLLLLIEPHIYVSLYKQNYFSVDCGSHASNPSFHDVLYVEPILHQWARVFSVTAQPFITLKLYCTVLIWKGQLFILISSSLKWCFFM